LGNKAFAVDLLLGKDSVDEVVENLWVTGVCRVQGTPGVDTLTPDKTAYERAVGGDAQSLAPFTKWMTEGRNEPADRLPPCLISNAPVSAASRSFSSERFPDPKLLKPISDLTR